MAFKVANQDITLVNGNTVKGIDRVDLWVGGLIEQHINGGMVGQTFWVILHEQLDRLQEADRFYYKDRVDNFAFYDQIDGGAEQGFGAIVARNTGMAWGGTNVFLIDNQGPEVVQFAPTDGAVNVEVNASILLTFNEAIHFGQGVIELRLANGTHVESFVIGSSPRVTIAGRLLTIDPTQTLLGNSEYNIIISQGVVLDGSDNAFAGTSTYDFTTKFIAITGDQQANVLTGTAGGDEIFGLDGNDWLNGLDGNDRLDGGTGADQMTGGAGDDIIDGDAGNDYIEGGPGNDLLIGGADIDTVSYAAAPAVVVVNPMGGAITLRGVTVDLRVTVAQDTFAAGLDTLDGIENIIGTPYDDILTGDDNANVIEGLSGADVINGGAGDDTIVDVIGADTINGGAGRDTIRLSATSAALNAMTNAALTNVEAINAATAAAGVVVNLGLQTEGFAVTGSAFNDTLTGGAGVDNVNAGAGDDTILGVVGADTINGGAGTDTIRITATSAALNAMTDARLINVEAIDASTAAAGVVVNLSNQTEGFTFTGSAFADTFTGTGAADTIVGVVGADTINGGAGTDTIRLTATSADLNAMTNARLINVEAIDASTAAAGVTVSLANQSENFIFRGSAFADNLSGGSGADNMAGGAGVDTINGGVGNDTLNGGLGNDVMTGGGGSDIFRFDTAIAGGGNVDRITDYNVAADSMQLSRAIFTGLATTGGGQLAASAFSLNAARGNAAQIVYNTNTGALFYDSNGAAGGGATQFGTLTSPTGTINNQEFFLV